ncbi:hypothetical protein BH23BAC1_BH23BAC1_13160 [soil metagenome]
MIKYFFKFYIRFLSISLVAILIIFASSACEPEETIFEGPYHVRFTEAEGAARESFNKPIKISVHLVGPQRPEPITVYYSVDGDAREGVDYEILGNKGSVTIPANQSFGYIDIRLINNANNILDQQEVIFTITGVTPENIQIGRSKDGIIGKTTTFTIFDDCILSGYYVGTRGRDFPSISGIKITSTDCNEYLLSNWDVYIFSFPTRRNLTFIDNGDNTLTIPEQEEQTLPDDLATISGTGSVNPLTGVITLNITLQDFEDSPTEIVTFVPE